MVLPNVLWHFKLKSKTLLYRNQDTAKLEAMKNELPGSLSIAGPLGTSLLNVCNEFVQNKCK